MKVTLSQVLGSIEVIKSMTKVDLPVKTGYKVVTLTKEIENKLKTFEMNRVELIQKYGRENERGVFSVSDEDKDSFNADYQSLMNTEIELECDKFALDAFPDSFRLTPTQLNTIEWLIDSGV